MNKVDTAMLIIMHCPNPPDSYMQLQRNLDKSRNPYNDYNKPKLRDDLEIIVDYKIAAYKMLLTKL